MNKKEGRTFLSPSLTRNCINKAPGMFGINRYRTFPGALFATFLYICFNFPFCARGLQRVVSFALAIAIAARGWCVAASPA